MKTVPIWLSDPVAKEFSENVSNLMKILERLSKSGILTKIDISYDESRDQAVKSEFKQHRLSFFDDKDLKL